MEIQVRYGICRDKVAIVDFQQKMAWETEGLKLNVKKLSNGVNAVFEDKSKGRYIIAEANNKVIASMMLTPEWSDWRNSNFLWIQSVYVVEKYRQKGVFKKMFDFAHSIVEASSEYSGLRLYVEKNNAIAQQVYLNNGMDGEHYRMFEWEKK